jgi:hypothetical protein
VATAAPAPPRNVAHGRPARRRLPGGAVWAVVLPIVAAYLVVALLMPLPVYYRDEGLYQHLARSLADGDGFSWRGEPIELRSALYVYLIAPAWAVASGVDAYNAAKVETTVLASLVALPVWLLARSIMPAGPALVAVAASLAGTWMGTGQLVTESIGLPLATAGLCVTVQAIRRPRAPLPWLALGLALLAAWARIQLVVLVPVILLALALDVVRSGAAWRARWRVHRAPLLAGGGAVAVGVVAVALAGTALAGGYSGILGFHPRPWSVARASGLEALQLAALCGFLPLALLAVLALRRAAWHDDVVGPLLSVLLPATVVLAIQSGFYVSGVTGLWSIQRYMIYVGPLLLVFAIAAFTRRGLAGPRVLIGAGLVSVAVLAMPEVAERSEQRAVFATAERLRDFLPTLGAGAAMLIVAVALAVTALAALMRDRRGGGSLAPMIVGASLLAVLVTQSVTVFSWQWGVERESRRLLPDDLAWVDHHSRGPVAVLELTNNAFEFPLLDFFNKNIEQYYALATPISGAMLQGGFCQWRIARDGALEFPADCPLRTDELLLNDPMAHLRFRGERSSVAERHVGRLVRVQGPPRLSSVVFTPCNRPVPVPEPVTLRPLRDQPIPCTPVLSGVLWLDAPGTVRVAIAGAPFQDHVAMVGGRRHAIPANTRTSISIPIGHAGRQEFKVELDWAQRSRLDPEVVSIDLEQDGRRRSLL